jgi:hypothetical protein
LIFIDSPAFKFQQHLAPYDFIIKQKGFYSAYWDTGIFGNYFVCEPERAQDVIMLSLEALQSNFIRYLEYATSVTD